MKIVKLIAKNFRILLRSRSAALIILFGPLFIMILAGMAFNNANSFELRVGILSNVDTETSQLFTNSLSKEYAVIDFDDIDVCIDSVRSGSNHACIVYPDDFIIEQGKLNDIELFVDTSKTNIVDLIEQSLGNIISIEGGKISTDLTTKLVNTIDATVASLEEDREIFLGALHQKSLIIVTGLTDISNQVGNLNLSYDKDKISLEGVSLVSKSIESYAGNIKSDAEGISDVTDDLADDVINLNISGSLNSVAEDAKDDVDTIEAAMASDMESIEALQNDILHMVSNAERNLDALSVQLDGAKVQNAKIIKDISLQKTELGVLKQTLINFELSVNNTLAQLSGVEITNIASIVHPITITPRTVVGNISKLNFIFPTLMMLVIMFVSIMLSSTLIIMEKLSPARFRVFMTPTKEITFLLATFLTVVIIILLQIVIVALVAQLGFNIMILQNIITTLLVLFFASFIFIFIGMCIGYIFSTEQTAILGAISVGSLFLLISDLILPLESMPALMQGIIEKTPFVLSTNVLRQTIIFNTPIAAVQTDFIWMVLYALTLFLLIIAVHKIASILFVMNHARRAKK
jgi:ABC-type multidrug transport system permease subunit